MQLGVWGPCKSLSGFGGKPGAKALEKSTILGLRLGPFRNNKAKTVGYILQKNCYCNLKYAQLCLLFKSSKVMLNHY